MKRNETWTAEITAETLAECIKYRESWQTPNAVLQGIILESGYPDSYYTHSIYPYIDDDGVGCYEITAPVTITGLEEHGEIIWDEIEVEDFPEEMVNALLSELIITDGEQIDPWERWECDSSRDDWDEVEHLWD